MTILELAKLDLEDIEIFDLLDEPGKESRFQTAFRVLGLLLGLKLPEYLEDDYRELPMIKKIEDLLFSENQVYDLIKYSPNDPTYFKGTGETIIGIGEFAKIYFGGKWGAFEKIEINNDKISLLLSIV